MAPLSPHRPTDTNRNTLCWPPLRSDVLAAACLAIVGCCLACRLWPALACAALGGAVLAGLAPRMRGRWRLRFWGGEVEGRFRDREDQDR